MRRERISLHGDQVYVQWYMSYIWRRDNFSFHSYDTENLTYWSSHFCGREWKWIITLHRHVIWCNHDLLPMFISLILTEILKPIKQDLLQASVYRSFNETWDLVRCGQQCALLSRQSKLCSTIWTDGYSGIQPRLPEVTSGWATYTQHLMWVIPYYPQ